MRGHLEGDVAVTGYTNQLPEQVARLGGTERTLLLNVVLLDQVVEGALVERNAHRFALAHEDIEELLRGGIGHAELVLDTSQEGVVYEVFGLRLVESTRNSSNGSWSFLPVLRVR